MADRNRLLWIDSCGGLVVGVIVLAIGNLLADWHQLPYGLILVMGIANLVYGSYSFSLAVRQTRPRVLIHLLILANLIWALICFLLIAVWRDSISFLGVLHLGGEGLYVGGLACLEWRWRAFLYQANPAVSPGTD